MKTLSIFLISLLTFVGCATIPQGTAPSASPLVSEDGKPKEYQIVGRAEGNAGHFTLFGFIPLGRSDIDAAVQDAIKTHRGDNLINVRYYVNSAWYFIGSQTSITVRGDVIKYGAGTGTTTPISRPLKSSGGMNVFHRFNIGSAVDGFSIEYMAQSSLSDYLFAAFGIGYKRINNFENALPIAINIGGTAKKLIKDIPLNPYASVGIAYIPLFSTSVWNQVGFNANIGVDYEVTKGIGVGIDYKYFKSLVDLKGKNEGISFSNLNLSVVVYP
jgi:opacity protein-like surface antigen